MFMLLMKEYGFTDDGRQNTKRYGGNSIFHLSVSPTISLTLITYKIKV